MAEQKKYMSNVYHTAERMVPAMAYVPWQKWTEIYDLNKGFMLGTIFPCLNKPFNESLICRGGVR